MANECIICGDKTNMFDKSALSGKICRKCLSYIPEYISLKACETDYLKTIYARNKEKADRFECTSSYGTVYIDQIHNMICVSDKGTKDNPKNFSVIADVTEIEEIGLYLSDVKNIGKNSIQINANVKITLKTKEMHKEFIVAHNKTCPYKAQDGRISYEEPREVTMLRTMLNQMIENEGLAMIKKLKRLQELKKQTDKFDESKQWARGVLFLESNKETDDETLKTQRNKLVRIFHPDFNKESADNDITAQINEAYKILGGK